MAVDLNDLYDAYRINQESKIGNEKRLNRRLKRHGLLDDEGNVLAPEGYDPTSFDPTSGDAFSAPERARTAKYLRGPYSRPSIMRKRFQEMQADIAKKKMDQFKETTIDPLTGSVSAKLQEMLANPAFDPEELANMRSDLVAQARSAEANRLKRVGATLGLRGLDPGTVAGASLVNRVAEDTDRMITDTLRQFGFDVANIERESEVAELGLSTQLATQMAQLETALTQGNYEQVFQISNDIGAIHEALEARKDAERIQKGANRMDYYGGMIKAGLGAAGSVAGGVAGGV